MYRLKRNIDQFVTLFVQEYKLVGKVNLDQRRIDFILFNFDLGAEKVEVEYDQLLARAWGYDV